MSPFRAFPLSLILLAGLGTSQASQGVTRVRWLTGCWETSFGLRIVRENWAAPANGVMVETGSTTRGDTLIESEMIRVFQRGADLIYQAHPKGQASAEFKATTVNDSTVVFSNPAHDFPKTIAYRFRGDSLLARVEGPGPGTPGAPAVRMIDFNYQRVPCTARRGK